jgi:hypothetical protein
LDAISRAIRPHSQQVWESLEADARTELGVEPGMVWSLMEWKRRQPMGRLTTLNRCITQDILAYQWSAQGNHAACRAQLAQNIRSKMQTVYDQGLWTHGWHLCGAVDPCARKAFAAPITQISAVADYVAAMTKLRGHLGAQGARSSSEPVESWNSDVTVPIEEEAEHPPGQSSDRRRHPKAKAKGKP